MAISWSVGSESQFGFRIGGVVVEGLEMVTLPLLKGLSMLDSNYTYHYNYTKSKSLPYQSGINCCKIRAIFWVFGLPVCLVAEVCTDR